MLLPSWEQSAYSEGIGLLYIDHIQIWYFKQFSAPLTQCNYFVKKKKTTKKTFKMWYLKAFRFFLAPESEKAKFIQCYCM